MPSHQVALPVGRPLDELHREVEDQDAAMRNALDRLDDVFRRQDELGGVRRAK